VAAQAVSDEQDTLWRNASAPRLGVDVTDQLVPSHDSASGLADPPLRDW
jgi:hypothetical protein